MLETVTEFFKWCTVIHLGLFVFTAIMCIWCRPFIQRIHGKMFNLSEDTVNAMLYGFLSLYKILFFIFVLVPWIALLVIG